MAEYIEREATIEALAQMQWHDENGYPVDAYEEKKKYAEDWISQVPSADVQPVRYGRWETEICDDGYGAYNLFVCSLCGSESAKRFNYCRECGAKMSGGDA